MSALIWLSVGFGLGYLTFDAKGREYARKAWDWLCGRDGKGGNSGDQGGSER